MLEKTADFFWIFGGWWYIIISFTPDAQLDDVDLFEVIQIDLSLHFQRL